MSYQQKSKDGKEFEWMRFCHSSKYLHLHNYQWLSNRDSPILQSHNISALTLHEFGYSDLLIPGKRRSSSSEIRVPEKWKDEIFNFFRDRNSELRIWYTHKT